MQHLRLSTQRTIRFAALGLAAACATGAAAAPARSPILTPDAAAGPWNEALDWGFVFASSLSADRKDMGAAQQAAVLAYAEMGDRTLAARRADLIEGWRRGLVYADLAGAAAKAGDAGTARALIDKAETLAATISGWETKRIEAHIADALALLGDTTSSERIATDLAENDPRQYTGRAAASVAVGHAVQGDFEAAMARLAAIDDSNDFDVAWARTQGYIEVATSGKITDKQRIGALVKAMTSVGGVSGWKAAEGRLQIAEAYLDLGHAETARKLADDAESGIRGIADNNPSKPTALGRAAELRQRLGQTEQARAMLAEATRLVPLQLTIDIPGIWAALAGSYRRIGSSEEASRLFDQALTSAQALQNARPRALSMTAICIQLGRAETELDTAARDRFLGIYAGLGDPW